MGLLGRAMYALISDLLQAAQGLSPHDISDVFEFLGRMRGTYSYHATTLRLHHVYDIPRVLGICRKPTCKTKSHKSDRNTATHHRPLQR